MIGTAQPCGKALEFIAPEPDTTTRMQHAVFEIRDLDHGGDRPVQQRLVA